MTESQTTPNGPMMTATEVLRRQKEWEDRMAKLKAKDPLAFALAVDAISAAQWKAYERRFARQKGESP
jgi:hypothetical protein